MEKQNEQYGMEADLTCTTIDRQFAVILGIDPEFPFPKRTRPYQLSPFAEWKINKNISDYIGIIPAMLLSKLFELRQYFYEDNLMNMIGEPVNLPFILDYASHEQIAFDMGVPVPIVNGIIDAFVNAKFLVKGEVTTGRYKDLSKGLYKGSDEFAWYKLDEALMDEKFFA